MTTSTLDLALDDKRRQLLVPLIPPAVIDIDAVLNAGQGDAA